MPVHGLMKQSPGFFRGEMKREEVWVATSILTRDEAKGYDVITPVLMDMFWQCLSALRDAENIQPPSRNALDDLTMMHFNALFPFIEQYLVDNVENGRMMDWFAFHTDFFGGYGLITAFSVIPLVHLPKPDLGLVLQANLFKQKNSVPPRTYWVAASLSFGFSGIYGGLEQEKRILQNIWRYVELRSWIFIREALSQQSITLIYDRPYDERVAQAYFHLLNASSPDELSVAGHRFRFSPMYVDDRRYIVVFVYDSGSVYVMLDDTRKSVLFVHRPKQPVRRLLVDQYVAPLDLWLAMIDLEVDS